MDPDATLEELREWAQRVLTSTEKLAPGHARAANHFVAIDEWITQGGFLPDDWGKGHHAECDISCEHVRFLKANEGRY